MPNADLPTELAFCEVGLVGALARDGARADAEQLAKHVREELDKLTRERGAAGAQTIADLKGGLDAALPERQSR